MSTVDQDTDAVLTEAPTDLTARVIDRDGDVWIPLRVTGGKVVWGCQTTASTIQHWHDLRNVCGPLRLAAQPPQDDPQPDEREALARAWNEGAAAGIRRGVPMRNPYRTEREHQEEQERRRARVGMGPRPCGECGLFLPQHVMGEGVHLWDPDAEPQPAPRMQPRTSSICTCARTYGPHAKTSDCPVMYADVNPALAEPAAGFRRDPDAGLRAAVSALLTDCRDALGRESALGEQVVSVRLLEQRLAALAEPTPGSES